MAMFGYKTEQFVKFAQDYFDSHSFYSEDLLYKLCNEMNWPYDIKVKKKNGIEKEKEAIIHIPIWGDVTIRFRTTKEYIKAVEKENRSGQIYSDKEGWNWEPYNLIATLADKIGKRSWKFGRGSSYRDNLDTIISNESTISI